MTLLWLTLESARLLACHHLSVDGRWRGIDKNAFKLARGIFSLSISLSLCLSLSLSLNRNFSLNRQTIPPSQWFSARFFTSQILRIIISLDRSSYGLFHFVGLYSSMFLHFYRKFLSLWFLLHFLNSFLFCISLFLCLNYRWGVCVFFLASSLWNKSAFFFSLKLFSVKAEAMRKRTTIELNWWREQKKGYICLTIKLNALRLPDDWTSDSIFPFSEQHTNTSTKMYIYITS